MSLSIALNQITRKTWWNDPPQPWKSNKKRLNDSAERRIKLFNQIKRHGRPVLFSSLAESNQCTIQVIRGLSNQMVIDGKLRRVQIDGKMALEVIK